MCHACTRKHVENVLVAPHVSERAVGNVTRLSSVSCPPMSRPNCCALLSYSRC